MRYSLRDGRLVTILGPPGMPEYLTHFGQYLALGRPQPGNPFPLFACPDGLNPPTALGFSGCLLQTSVEVAVPVTIGSTGVNLGYASLDVPFPLVVGGTPSLFSQWLVFGRGAFAPGAVSDGLASPH